MNTSDEDLLVILIASTNFDLFFLFHGFERQKRLNLISSSCQILVFQKTNSQQLDE